MTSTSCARRVAALVRSGVTVLVLLALSDEGAPVANHHEAAALAALGAHVATCTPDQFPEVLAATLEGRELPAEVTEVAAVRQQRSMIGDVTTEPQIGWISVPSGR